MLCYQTCSDLCVACSLEKKFCFFLRVVVMNAVVAVVEGIIVFIIMWLHCVEHDLVYPWEAASSLLSQLKLLNWRMINDCASDIVITTGNSGIRSASLKTPGIYGVLLELLCDTPQIYSYLYVAVIVYCIWREKWLEADTSCVCSVVTLKFKQFWVLR